MDNILNIYHHEEKLVESSIAWVWNNSGNRGFLEAIDHSKKDKLEKELESFKQIWSGGYLTGYSKKRNQKGLEKYLKNNLTGKTILEIGCGGGQWSKLIYQKNVFDKIYCVDALSEEHNNFRDNVRSDSKHI